jgi:hypothetical protein
MINPTTADLGRRVVFFGKWRDQLLPAYGHLDSFDGNICYVRYGDSEAMATLPEDLHWAGPENTTLAPEAPMHTKDMLADALQGAGLYDMSLKARGGYYHDFLSPLDMPELQLIEDLTKAATPHSLALIPRVINGEFDASKEEGDEWAESDDGQQTFKRLLDKD